MFESTRRVHTTTKNVKKKAKDNRCMLECQRCEYGDGDKENEYILPLLNKNFASYSKKYMFSRTQSKC